MQKFKIDREKLLEGLNGSKTGFIYNLLELPDTIILEGELLEGGGTVDKCACSGEQLTWDYHTTGACHKTEKCKACEMAKEGYSGVPPHTCHNKKEEKTCVCPSCQAGHKNGHNAMRNFNRETTKCCCEGRIKAPASHSLNVCVTISEVEVKLPEPIDENVDTDWKLALKINEILAYLASKENK